MAMVTVLTLSLSGTTVTTGVVSTAITCFRGCCIRGLSETTDLSPPAVEEQPSSRSCRHSKTKVVIR